MPELDDGGFVRELATMLIRAIQEGDLPSLRAQLQDQIVTTPPPAGSVGSPQLADGSVTEAKLAFAVATQAELDAVAAAKADASALANYLLLASVSLTPGANIVPRAGVAGKLAAGWIPAIDLASMVTGQLPLSGLSASGTRDATTYLRGDGTWATPVGGGVSTLRGATDYDDTTAPTPGQAIAWNGTKYAPATLSSSGSGAYGQGTHVYSTVNQPVANSTPTTLTFNSERSDTDTSHSTSTNPSRLTCQTAGTYLIIANIAFAASTGGTFRELLLRLNGTTYIAGHDGKPVVAGSEPLVHVATVSTLAAGDYVEVQAYHDAGVTLNVMARSSYSPEFMMQRIG